MKKTTNRRFARIPLPFHPLEPVPFASRWVYVIAALDCQDNSIDQTLRTGLSSRALSLNRALESEEPVATSVSYGLEQSALLIEWFFERLLFTYAEIPVELSNPTTATQESFTSDPFCIELKTSFRYREWAPEDRLYGRLFDFWEFASVWLNKMHRMWVSGHQQMTHLIPSTETIRFLERRVTFLLRRHYPYATQSLLLSPFHTEYGMGETLQTHLVGRFRQWVERIYWWVKQWNELPYDLYIFLPPAVELVELMGEMMQIIALKNQQVMWESWMGG
jgi:hypothetical protein